MKNKLTAQLFFVLFVALLFVSTVSAQATDKIDDYIREEMQKSNIPGIALAVIKEGKLVKSKTYGLANIETNTSVTPETVFKIGSISKPIIAMGIMLLVEEGKINLDDKISQYLEGTPEIWKHITVRHLLSHTSGIVREAPGFDPFKIQTDAEVIKTAYSLPLNFSPGEKYEYCNVGYFSLAEIIRKVSGKPWSDFLAARIFKPFGMNSTRATSFSEIIPHRANGYTFQNGKLSNEENYLAVRPSGAFLSTLTDLAKLEAALNGTIFLKSETRKAMWTPFKFNDGKNSSYGLGWVLDEANGKKRIHHGGNLNGFKSEYSRFVDDKLTVIILTNLNEAVPAPIALKVAELMK